MPSLSNEIPNKGMAINTAGTNQMSVLSNAVQVKAVTISPIFN